MKQNQKGDREGIRDAQIPEMNSLGACFLLEVDTLYTQKSLIRRTQHEDMSFRSWVPTTPFKGLAGPVLVASPGAVLMRPPGLCVEGRINTILCMRVI